MSEPDPFDQLERRGKRRLREVLAHDGGELPDGMFDHLNGEMVKDMFTMSDALTDDEHAAHIVRRAAIVLEAIFDCAEDDVDELSALVAGRLDAAGFSESDIEEVLEDLRFDDE